MLVLMPLQMEQQQQQQCYYATLLLLLNVQFTALNASIVAKTGCKLACCPSVADLCCRTASLLQALYPH